MSNPIADIMQIIKNIFRGLMPLLMTMMLAPSCIEEAMHQMPAVDEIVTYTAYADSPDTKTTLKENRPMWKGEEWIQVVGRNGNYWMGTNVSGSSVSASFTYNGDNGEFNETDVMAVYPAGSSNYGKDFENMSVSGVTIPSVQNAVVGSYDPNAAVAIAYSHDRDLKFKNAVSLLKFTMGSDGVKNVTVWGEGPKIETAAGDDFVKEGCVYVTVDQAWLSDGARFAAYLWNSSGETWTDLVQVQELLYECQIPEGYDNIIFCRMKPNSSNSWTNMWNQTVDLTLSANNHFTMTDPWGNDANGKKATGSWSDMSASAVTRAGMSGTGTLFYNDGTPFITGTTTGYVSLNGDFEKGKTYYIAVAPIIFENGMTVEFSHVGDYDKFEVKKYTQKVELKRNTIHNMGVIRSTKETGFFTEPVIPDADEPCTIYFRAPEGSPLYGHADDLYVHVWINNSQVGSTWGDNDEKYKFAKVEGEVNLWSVEVETSIREWLGSGGTSCGKVGILARNAAADKQSEDYYLRFNDSKYALNEIPDGVQHGINYIDENTVTLVLYDRDNKGKSHDFCNLLWDENWWGDRPGYPKDMSYDSGSGCWWITLTDLDPNKQYKFQYQLGYGSNVTVTTFDPYTEIVYDTHHDAWVGGNYPGISEEFGDNHYGRASGFISAFKINKNVYNWKVRDYNIEDKDDLVIYELLVRDFTDNSYGEGSIKAAKEQIGYLKELGVNAVELMPVQEFDGNDSWGYGNHAYFALDKAYGTRKDYKDFIDACHQNGIAVILDVAFNHATGAHPYAAMYWDYDKTAENNPWFNVYAPHGWSVYHDWNHSNPMVREHVKRSLAYLMTEYKVDGFRFDLSKGFMQGGNEGSYNQERVNYLKEYNAHIQSVDNHAVMICEHFVDDENYELGNSGIKVWRNMNHPYCEAAMGWMSGADFSGVTSTYDQNGNFADYTRFGTYVGYMESHDEERMMFKAKEYGTGTVKGSEETRMRRAGLNAAFFLLTPGPKMIWQFGEIGYDIRSKKDNGHGGEENDLGKKPWKTAEYMANANRKALYDTYSMLLKFRKDNPRFFDNDVNFRWYVGSGEQTGRYMFARSGEGKQFALFGNFGSGNQNISVELPHGGDWYQYDNGATWSGKNHSLSMSEGQFYILVSDRSMCLK